MARGRRSAPPPHDPEAGFVPIGFSIVGVQKAGTSTLSATLDTHPQVAPAHRKELHFFDDETRDWKEPDYTRYRARRSTSRQVTAGDATPLYIWWPGALERMHAYHPGMRLVATFRDPIERAFSQWTMFRGGWPDTAADWPVLIGQFRPTSLPAALPEGVSAKVFANRSAVARGYYGQMLERGFALFPSEQWLLLEFRAMLADFAGTVHRLTYHLGLERFDAPPAAQQKRAGPPTVTGTAPTAADVAGLAELYADDLELFRLLSGIDVSAWPTARILAGTMQPAELADRLASKVRAVETG